jgi:hypothetical protein
LNPNE